MASPSMTFNAAGNALSSQSLAAAANVNTATLDYSTKIEAQVHVKNTPGATVAATRGCQIDVYRMYGSTPTIAQSSSIPVATLPSATGSVAESLDFYLGTGKYQIKLTNLDASNAITVEITVDTVDAIA